MSKVKHPLGIHKPAHPLGAKLPAHPLQKAAPAKPSKALKPPPQFPSALAPAPKPGQNPAVDPGIFS